MVHNDASWEIEALIRKAFTRLKDRFLTYVLAYFLMIALLMAIFFVMLFIIVFAATVFSLQAHILTGMILALLVMLCSVAILYIISFSQLLIVHTLIRESKGTLMQNIRDVKPHVWGYVWFMVASSLFFIGLLPFGFLSLFVIFILWMFWGYFSTFVFLTYKRKGLDNLWTSYAMVNQRFWGISGRIFIVMIGYFVIMNILSVPYDPQNDGGAGAILMLLQFVIGLVAGAFTLCYHYEIFRLVEVPEKVERPKAWIILSIIGGVLMALLLFASGQEIVNGGARMKDFFKENFEQEYKNNYQDKEKPSAVSNHVRYPRSS